MTFVKELDRELIPKLVGMREAWSTYRSELDRDRMVRLLAETYHYIRHSVPLMEVASEACEETRPETAHYFEHHIEEEKDHDVWLLEDLESIGLSSEEVRNSLPLRSTLGMVASQYFLIERVNPTGLLGYMYILEGLTPDPKNVEEYAETAGLPKQALRTIMEHCELDPHHVAEMREALSSEELTEEDHELIVFNAKATLEYLTEMYGELRRASLSATLDQGKVPA